jgi:hypothetical protein
MAFTHYFIIPNICWCKNNVRGNIIVGLLKLFSNWNEQLHLFIYIIKKILLFLL